MELLEQFLQEYLFAIYIYVLFVAVILAATIRWIEYQLRFVEIDKPHRVILLQCFISKYWKSFRYQSSLDFYECQWQKRSTLSGGYMIYRSVACMYNFNLFICGMFAPDVLTDADFWGSDFHFVASLMFTVYILNVLVSTFNFYSNLEQEYNTRLEARDATRWQILNGSLQFLSFSIAFGITAYAIAKPMLIEVDHKIAFRMHVLNITVMFIDLLITRHKIFLIHLFCLCGFFLIHFGTILLYTVASHDYTFLLPFTPHVMWDSNYLVVVYFLLVIIHSSILFIFISLVIYMRRNIAHYYGFHIRSIEINVIGNNGRNPEIQTSTV